MRQTTQDTTARRIQFDCELPEDVRRQLGKPKRARIFLPPEPPRKMSPVNVERPRWRPSLGWILILAALAALGLVLALSWPSPVVREKARGESAARSREVQTQVAKALDALRNPPPVQQQTPANATQPAVQRPAAVPRAELVAIYGWRVGTKLLLMMPYNLQVSATLRGAVASESMLPMSGNHIGDTFVVGSHAWLWVVAPGAGAPSWVDP